MGAKYKTFVEKASRPLGARATTSPDYRTDFQPPKPLRPSRGQRTDLTGTCSSDGSSFSSDTSNASETTSVKGSDSATSHPMSSSSGSVGSSSDSESSGDSLASHKLEGALSEALDAAGRRSRDTQSRLAWTQGSVDFLLKNKKQGGRDGGAFFKL